ncbi:MAG: SDR family oxidoreductase [Burkholderiales bacterium]
MNLTDARILLTGAGSGIGRACALRLAQRGARLALLGRDAARLADVQRAVEAAGGRACTLVFDLASDDGHSALVAEAAQRLDGLDIVINNAGVGGFGAFETADPADLRRLVQTNLLAPMLLVRAALPLLLARPRARIVNIGSAFGSIAFAYFAAYSASKFGLRGFSEALRRELADTFVGVTYVAPRTTRTELNPPALYAMSAQTNTAIDSPDTVAAAVADAIVREQHERFVGRPESLFARINGVFPGLIDAALRRQNRLARDYARK